MSDSSSNPPSFSPLPRDPAIQVALDAEHLRLLKIGYHIAGTVTAVFSCFFILHFLLFLVFGLNPQFFTHQAHSTGKNVDPPPPGLFLGFAGVIGLVIILGWIFGALQIYAGRSLDRREHFTLVIVIAALKCLFIPWGTTLGVCTLIVLNRPSVKSLFVRV